MITEKQINEIRDHLKQAKNPLFFFDNDIDGLASFLLLQRYVGAGKGVAIKSYPGLSRAYFRKVEELHPDYIFVLDKPSVDEDFLEEVEKAGIPLVWIDHHDIGKPNIKNYYNTFHESGKTEPTSYLCYQVTKKKEDIWIAIIGCIGDCYIPDFLSEFKKENPDLVDYDYKWAFDVLYNTKIGKVARVLGFGLLDRTSNVVSMLRYLVKVKNAYDVLEENHNTRSYLNRYNQINEKYKKIIEKAERFVDKKNKLLFFTYGGDLSISQDVSNELIYRHPDLVVVVGYIKGNYANFSLRGNVEIKEITLNAIKNIEGATGGGHTYATGAKMTAEQVDKFKENILKELG